MRILNRLLAATALAAMIFPVAAHAAGTVEVLHWWTSGGEAKAVGELKKAFEAQGGKWIDSPIAAGGGDAAMTALRARVMAGNSPTAVQLKGPGIQEWAKEGDLNDVQDVATKEKWDAVLPPVLAAIMKYQGKYVAAPVNIHRVDWIWANPQVLAKVGITTMPKTWDEFNADADKLKAAGITPLANGSDPWQDLTLWDVIALGVGGADFYNKAIVQLDPQALASDTMVKVFDEMRRMRGARPMFLSSFIILAHLAIKSFDLVIALTGGGPGYATDMPATFMYSFAFQRSELGTAAASAVMMLVTILAIIVPYLYSELRGANK